MASFGGDRVQPGDVVLVHGKSWISKLIQLATGSPWSHAAPVVGVTTEGSKPIAYIYQVGSESFVARLGEIFGQRQFVILRPHRHIHEVGGYTSYIPLSAIEGKAAAEWLLRITCGLQTTYPWWELLGYLLRGRLSSALINLDARGVCSAMTARLLLEAGCLLQDSKQHDIHPDYARPVDFFNQGWPVIAWHNPTGEEMPWLTND